MDSNQRYLSPYRLPLSQTHLQQFDFLSHGAEIKQTVRKTEPSGGGTVEDRFRCREGMSALRPLARRALCLAVSLTAGLRLVGDIDVSRAARRQIHDKRRDRRIGPLCKHDDPRLQATRNDHSVSPTFPTDGKK